MPWGRILWRDGLGFSRLASYQFGKGFSPVVNEKPVKLLVEMAWRCAVVSMLDRLCEEEEKKGKDARIEGDQVRKLQYPAGNKPVALSIQVGRVTGGGKVLRAVS